MVTVLFEHPCRGEKGALIDFLKNLTIMSSLLTAVLREQGAVRAD